MIIGPPHTRIVLLLGLGPAKEPPWYHPAVYHRAAEGFQADGPSPLALVLHIEEARARDGALPTVEVIGTAEVQARWITSGLLADILAKHELADVVPSFRLAPSGSDPGDAPAFVTLVQPLLRPAPLSEDDPAPTRIVFDITHGFRAQSMLATSAVEATLDEDLRQGRTPILEVVYAAWEARDLRTTRTPVWDLTGLLSQHAWSSAIHGFRAHGRADAFCHLCEALGQRRLGTRHQDLQLRAQRDSLVGLGRAARTLADDLACVRLPALLTRDSAVFLDYLDRAGPLVATEGPAVAGPLADLAAWARTLQADKVVSDAGLQATVQVARLCLETERFAACLAVLREGAVIAATLSQVPPQSRVQPAQPDQTERWKAQVDEAEDWLNEQAHDVPSVDIDPWASLFAAVGDQRNDVLHAGLRSDPAKAASIRKALTKLVNQAATLVRLPVQAPPP